MITAILLAAGAARRFGAPKLLEELNGKPVVRWSVEGLLGAPVDEVVVVVPPAHDAIGVALAGLDVRLVVNANPDMGMGRSLACGIDALGAGTDAALVALADEPMTHRVALLSVVARYHRGDASGDASIVVPRFRGIRGHPVLFDRSVFPALATLTGDQGARALTETDSARVAFVELDQMKPIDVDTLADLSRLRSAIQFTSSSNPPKP